MTIAAYLKRVKERLLNDPVVASFYIIRERSALSNGYLRIRLTLQDGSFLEFSEYSRPTNNKQIKIVTYSYHWATSDGKLIKRWDNTPHFPKLSGFPHHIHDGHDNTVIPSHETNIFAVLDEITDTLA